MRNGESQWVALKPDRRTVIAAGASLAVVRRDAERKGAKQPILIRLPKRILSFVGPAPFRRV
ncbi:MAG: hypothetical protein PHU04_05025 [Candidatus Peribacteraceae bacterium]|nr:hypothetical protein [Candidatus Peribacteraceae bacterium]